MNDTLTQAQRDHRRQQARTSIRNALAATWPDWRRRLSTPDFGLAADAAVDGLGDMAAEILADGTLLKSLTTENGVVTLEFEPSREQLQILVASMRTMLDSYGAENYVEQKYTAQAPSVSLDLRDGRNPADAYTVTIQRRTRPTPHEFRLQAEARVTELEDALSTCRADTERDVRAAVAADFVLFGQHHDTLPSGQAADIAYNGLCQCRGGQAPCVVHPDETGGDEPAAPDPVADLLRQLSLIKPDLEQRLGAATQRADKAETRVAELEAQLNAPQREASDG